MSEEVRRYRLAGLTDPGTRLWNRDALYGEIAERGEAFRRGKGRGFGLLLADVDRFKEWNDARGHLAGDRLLLRAARALLDASRPQDFVARYGGDEYAVVVGDVDGETLPALASRLREALGAALSEETDGFLSSASIGTELFDGARHRTPEDLLRDADRKLYEAKEAFRAGNPVRDGPADPVGEVVRRSLADSVHSRARDRQAAGPPWTLFALLPRRARSPLSPSAESSVDPLPPETRASVAALAAKGAGPTRATEWVRRLTDEVGPRLAGSPGDRAAVAWGQALLRELGFANVRAEEVPVTAWSRGVETAAGRLPVPAEARRHGAGRERRDSGGGDHGARRRDEDARGARGGA